MASLVVKNAWYPWQEARPFDSAPVKILEEAALERASAAGVFLFSGTESITLACAAWTPPTLRRLSRLRSAIEALAPHFVRLSDDTYSFHCYRNFPIAYSAADLYAETGALAVLPGVGAPPSSPSALAAYRDFLAACQFWLERFRYVSTKSHAYCRSEIPARGVSYSSFNDAAECSSYEAACARAFRGEITLQPRDMSGMGDIPIYVADVERIHEERGSVNADGNWVQEEPRFYGTVRLLRAAGADLHVANPAGLSARCLLVPCGDTSADFDTLQIREYRPESRPYLLRGDDGRAIDSRVDSVSVTTSWQEIHGDNLGHAADVSVNYAQNRVLSRGASQGADGVRTENRRVWRVSEDGTRVFLSQDDSSSEEWSDPYEIAHSVAHFQPIATNEFIFNLADGFGFCKIGEPIDRGEVPPHTTRLVYSAPDALTPERLDLLDSYADLLSAENYLRLNSSTASATFSLRLMPVFDYDNGYMYQQDHEEVSI